MIYSVEIPSIQPEERVGLKQEGTEGGRLMQQIPANLMTQNVAKFHWSTNEYRYIFWDRLIMRMCGCGNLYLIFRKLKWRADHYPVSFLNTEENTFYAPSQFISLSILSSHSSLFLSSQMLESHSNSLL